MTLEPLPTSALDSGGAPRFGAFTGWLDDVDLSARIGTGWRARARRLRQHRRWVGGTVTAGSTFVSFGVVDAVYAVHAWAFASDFAGRRRLAGASWTGLPGMGLAWPVGGRRSELACSFQDLRLRLVPGADDGWLVSLHSRAMHVEARLSSGGATALTAVLPVTGGDVATTRRVPALAAGGTLTVGSQRSPLDGGVGFIEVANGLFARRAVWRRGFASGRAREGGTLAFHVAEGISDAPKNEQTLWVEGRPSAMGPVRLTGDNDRPMRRWNLTTSDGRLDLVFEPSVRHREPRSLGLLAGAVERVAGRFTGVVRTPEGTVRHVDGMAGMLELSDAVW